MYTNIFIVKSNKGNLAIIKCFTTKAYRYAAILIRAANISVHQKSFVLTPASVLALFNLHKFVKLVQF